MATVETPQPSKKIRLAPSPSNRLVSLDVYRGFIMILLAAHGFGLAATATSVLKESPDDTTWSAIQYQMTHLPWGGITVWDMIQPSFMFMVGVSMPFSYSKRKRIGHSYRRMFGHALWRGILLVLLGVFLRSLRTPSTNWFFMDVVAQIGLGYVFLFLLWGRSFKIQLGALVVILIGYWAFFAFWTLPREGFDPATVGVKGAVAEAQYTGFQAHWNMNTHPAHDFDLWFLNQFPRPKGKPFEFNAGGYNTLNFIPSIATMLLGLMAGTLLSENGSTRKKFFSLLGAGILCIAIGKGIELAGVCPIVKKIWTPTWVLYSGGFCLCILTAFYLVIDIIKFRWWAFPAVVVGMNSIAIYVMGFTIHGPTVAFLKRHFGKDIFRLEFVQKFIPSYDSVLFEPIVRQTSVLFVFWIILYWMYRNRFFIRL